MRGRCCCGSLGCGMGRGFILAVVLAVVLTVVLTASLFGGPFRRGDADASGYVDTTDAIRTLSDLFLDGKALGCEDAADANDDGELNLSDAIHTLDFLYVGTAQIAAPGPEACGEDPTPDALGCDRFLPCPPGEPHRPEDAAPPCGRFLAGPLPPHSWLAPCAGARPPRHDRPLPIEVAPGLGADRVPVSEVVLPRTSVAWHSGSDRLPLGPTAHSASSSFGGPLSVPQLATDLYSAAGGDRSALEFLESLEHGAVEIGRLGLVWGEVDRVYPGVTSEQDLVVGRRYYSRAALAGDGRVAGRVGVGWVHSFHERLVFVDADRLRHVSWDSPYDDSDLYYTRSQSGEFRGAQGVGATVRATTLSTSTERYFGAAYELRWPARVHYFDAAGRIVARVGSSGLDAIEFFYDGAGNLETVVDSRGQLFAIETVDGGIAKVTDSGASSIEYELTEGRLVRVVYPERDVVQVEDRVRVGAGLIYEQERRTTQRGYAYDEASGRLRTITDDSGDAVLSVSYVDDSSGRVSTVADVYGAWHFEAIESRTVRVTTPRGFQSDYLLDGNHQPVGLEQHPTGVGSAPSRPAKSVPATYSWQFLREDACECGRITDLIEPDGGGYAFYYDADGRLERMEKRPNPGAEAHELLVWTWRYDHEGRVVEYVPPEAHASARPEDYTLTLVVEADRDPTNDGGSVYTLSTPAGRLHTEAVEWVWRVDRRRRIVESFGPPHHDHGGLGEGGLGEVGGSGSWERFEYFAASDVDGSRALLLARHQGRREGPWTEFQYDDVGRVTHATTYDGAHSHTFTQEWNAEHQLVRWVAPANDNHQVVIEYLYDGDGRLAVVRFPYHAGQQGDPPLWLEDVRLYDAAGNVTRRQRDVEAGCRALEAYGYDAEGHLTQVMDPDGKVSRALYDARGLLWKTYDSYGTVEQVEREYFYNPDGRIVRHHEPFRDDFAVLERTYDAYDRLKSVGATGKLVVEDSFDPAGRVITRVVKSYVEGSPVETDFVETKREELTYRDWHDGATDRVLTIHSEDGSRVLRTLKSTVEYAPSSRPLTLSLGGIPYARFEYTSWGAPSAIVDAGVGGSREVLDYDPATGYLVRHAHEQWDPVIGERLVYERTLVTDPTGRVVEVSYHAPGAPSRVYRYGYDSLDHAVRVEDAAGVVTRLRYGYDGRLLERRRPLTAAPDARTEGDSTFHDAGSVERYRYTTGGRLSAATDGRGNTVTFLYDERGRKRREVNADGSFWHWDYTGGDFVERVVTPSGRAFAMTYNEWGLPSSRTVTTRSGELLQTVRYAWNPLGDLRSATKVERSYATTLALVRDSSGKVLRESLDGVIVSFERDALGRLERLVGPSGFARHFSYDDHHRVAEIRESGLSGHRVAELKYQGPGRSLRELVLGNEGTAARTSVQRDGFGRVARLRTTQSDVTLFDFEYGYNPNGRVRYERRLHDGRRGDAFVYDGLDRLTEFVRDSIDPRAQGDGLHASLPRALRRQYHLDADSHRRSVVTTHFGGSPRTEDYVTHAERHHYVAVDGVERRQDVDGRLTRHGDRRLTYDADDRLAAVTDGGRVTATYTYDAVGRRSTKTVDGATTRYVYAGPWLIEEYRDAGVGEDIEAVHYHATGVDDVVLSKRRDHADLDQDGETHELIDLYLHRNRLGSVVGLTLGDGGVVERYSYDAYGEPTIFDRVGCQVDGAPSGNPLLFAGRVYDPETGYYYSRARTYDPATGTFLQEDPLGLVDGLNPVAYVLANPSNFVDPLGTLALGAAVHGMLEFLQENRELLGQATDAMLDIIGPLGDLLDLLSAATGWDIRGWVRGGFRRLKVLGWWERVSVGLTSAAVVAGGVVSIAKVVARLDRIYDKLRLLVKKLKRAAKGHPKRGELLYRVWGDGARPDGRSWTRTNPRTIANYRDAAGLPVQNGGRFVSAGRLRDPTGVKAGRATPFHGKGGGLDEVIVPDPTRQIDLERVSGVNPEF